MLLNAWFTVSTVFCASSTACFLDASSACHRSCKASASDLTRKATTIAAAIAATMKNHA